MRSHRKRLVLRTLMVGATVSVLASCVPALAGVGFEVTYIQMAPPPRRVEVLTPVPGRGYDWIEGFWVYEYREYAWVPGHWERIPRRKAHWVQGRWRRHDRGWYWVPGHWR